MTDENVQIACHKLILSAASNYFRAMFTTAGMREADAACTKVPVHGVRAEVLQRLVQSAYSGEVSIEERTVCELLAAATMLQFQHVCEAGSQFLEQVSLLNLLNILMYENECITCTVFLQFIISRLLFLAFFMCTFLYCTFIIRQSSYIYITEFKKFMSFMTFFQSVAIATASIAIASILCLFVQCK